MVTIINYGVGNLGSIINMCKKIGQPCELTGDPGKILSAERLLLPGVGAFDRGISKLRSLGLEDVLSEAVLVNKTPILGICLGAQLMLESSDEGELPGLGWIKGQVRKFPEMTDGNGRLLKVPHMGWTEVEPALNSPMFSNWDEECRFYFVHSYYMAPMNPTNVSSTAEYGIQFCSSVQSENIWGAQFHPEKSHRYGMRFLKNAFSR